MVELKSLSGLAETIEQDVQIEVGAAETRAPFNEALIGTAPGDAKEVGVTYPADYGQERLGEIDARLCPDGPRDV